jgi:predicted dehydrogenase
MSDKDEGLRVGVVGCGYWGSKHVRILASLESVSEVVIIEPNSQRVASLLRDFSGRVSYPTLTSALDAVDAVVIATPPSTHLSFALEAIAAGKHVLVEKPLAATVADAHAIVDAAEAQGVTLMVGHTFEFHSAVWRLRDMVNNGEFGDLYYIDTARLNLGLYQHDVNVLFDLAPHDISILNYVLGRRPDSVECWTSRHAHLSLDDVAYMRLYYGRDCVAHVHVSWLDPKKVRRVTIVGSRKMAVFDDLETEDRIRVHDKAVFQGAAANGDLTQAPMSYRYGDVISPYLEVSEPLRVEDQHFVNCAQTGARPLVDGQNGIAVLEVLEGAMMSAREGRAVLIDEVRSGGTQATVVPLQRRALTESAP